MIMQKALFAAGIVNQDKATEATQRISDIRRIKSLLNSLYSNPIKNIDKITHLETKLSTLKG